MSARTIDLDKKLTAYLHAVSLREHPAMIGLRLVTKKHPMAVMQISPEQAQFMQLLIKMLGAKKCIEVGTFTGYSALAVALALPPRGKLVACDVSEDYVSIGKPYWEQAGVAGKIDLRIAPAKKTLNKMIKDGESGTYDFAFIDADKPAYPDYYERCLKLMKAGGVIAVDNVFMGGDVADKRKRGANAAAMRAFNEKLHADKRVDISMIPIGDGLTLARKV